MPGDLYLVGTSGRRIVTFSSASDPVQEAETNVPVRLRGFWLPHTVNVSLTCGLTCLYSRTVREQGPYSRPASGTAYPVWEGRAPLANERHTRNPDSVPFAK